MAPNPRPPDHGNPAITILRILLWLMPAIFIPICAVIAGRILIPLLRNSDAAFVLCILGATIATAAVGYSDRRLDLMQQKIAPPHSRKDLVCCTIIFVLAQIIVAPFVCIAVLYAWLLVE